MAFTWTNVMCCVLHEDNLLFYSYSLKGHQLEEVTTAKYLGVDLSSTLLWKDHIGRIVENANCTLGFLKGNLRISNSDTKAAACSTLVRPTLEYCVSVWSSYTAQSKHKLEMVQRRAARYCTNRYHNTSSVTDMLQDLQCEILEARRMKLKLMLFKIINDLVDIPAEEYLTPAITGLEHSTPRSSDNIQLRRIPSSASFEGQSRHGTLY